MLNRKAYLIFKPIRIIVMTLLLTVWNLSCSSDNAISEIQKEGRLLVLMRNTPTIYYEGPEGPKGFEYDLVKAFAKHLNVNLKVKIYDSLADLLDAIQQGEGDFASGAITKTEDREDVYSFGPDYYTVQQLVVYRRGTKAPKNIEDLTEFEIQIIAESSYEERLSALKEDYPDLNWTVTDEYSTEQLLQQVWRGELDCTVADQNIVAVNRRYFPGLEVAFPISEEHSLAWVINPQKASLGDELEEWLDSFEEKGGLAALRDKYYSYTELYDYVDLREFHKRINWRLPHYRSWFQEAAGKFNFSWTLLAALAYQESHWSPRAKSPTGVRGIMMLTRQTAQSVGVQNRLDPYQSIMGGAEYLARMVERVPDSVYQRDRIKFALAAYNVGMGHMEDARILAEKLGYDPNSWNELKEVLPLLTQKKYYSRLKHGYARGTEPVRYVGRIRNYQNILEAKFAGAGQPD